jgi:hypothetical protein
MLPKPAPEQPPGETFVFSRIATSLASSISASFDDCRQRPLGGRRARLLFDFSGSLFLCI